MFRTIKLNNLGGNSCVTSAGDRQLLTAGEKNLKEELIIVSYCLPRTVLFFSKLSFVLSSKFCTNTFFCYLWLVTTDCVTISRPKIGNDELTHPHTNTRKELVTTITETINRTKQCLL